MNHIGLHRYAIAVSAWMVLLLATGSLVTTEGALLSSAERPEAFGPLWAAAGPFTWPVSVAVSHRVFAALALPLTAVLAAWVFRAVAEPAVRAAAAGALAMLALEVIAGVLLVRRGASGWPGAMHAVLAQLVLVCTATAAAFTAPAWNREGERVHDYGWPTLRGMAVWVPFLVFVQILLGALYRHRVVSLIPHIAGALVTAGSVLLLGLFVTTQFPNHRVLRPIGKAVLGIMFVQVSLGVLTYVSGSAAAGEDGSPGVLGAAFIAAHTVAGGLLFVSCCLLGTQVRRYVQPKLAPEAGVQAAS